VHQGAWLLWATCAGLCAITTTNPFYLLVIVAIAWFVHALCSRPGPALRSFRVFLLFGALTIVTRTLLVFLSPPVSASSVVTGLLEGLRLASLLIVFGTFNAVSDPFAILKLAPRRFHEPALATALALSIAPRTIQTAGKVREAQRMRGIHISRLRSLPALAVPVLETGMEEAMVLAESMDARGHGRGPRTRYRPEPWTWTSFGSVALCLVPVIVFFTAIHAGTGGLTVSTYPLRWPQPSLLLLASLPLLCVPVLFDRAERP
jgi:energy-coupling factor transport system permease protein